MAVYSSLMLTSLLIVCTFSFNYPRLANDQMCKIKGALLCVKDELIIIATIAKGIARKLNETEKNIQQAKTLEILNKYVNTEMNYTNIHLPLRYYHDGFFRKNNIDTKFLIGLFFEAHDAMIYYYNSINDLINLKVLSVHEIDESFKKIQVDIQEEMICRYRSVLNVYSHQWKSFYEIGGIQFSKSNQRICPSCTHNVHSVVIIRYLRRWMELINEVTANLGMKFL